MNKNRFEVGEPILLAYTFGEPNEEGKSRYGEVKFGVINKVTYIDERDSYLYTVVLESSLTALKPHFLIRSERWIFKLDEIDMCEKMIKESIWGKY